MAEELVYPKDISPEMLKALFESAYFDTSVDTDGDVKVKVQYSSWIIPHGEGKRIRLMSQFRVNPTSSLPDRLAYANKVNDKLIIIRAYVKEDGRVGFDFYIPVDGGTTKHCIVAAVKKFHEMLEAAIQEDDKDVLG